MGGEAKPMLGFADLPGFGSTKLVKDGTSADVASWPWAFTFLVHTL